MELDMLKNKFTELYGKGGELLFFHSPGRVNLIGEHTDYNGGFVFPCALSLGTYGVVRKRDDNKVKMASTNFDLAVDITLENIVFDKKHGWANYLKGVILGFQKMGHKLSGMEILLKGNIPNEAGLSSSASIEILMSVILKHMNNIDISMIDMVKLSQKTENEFIGLNSGIMDQFAVGMGKKDNAIFLNCSTLNYEYVPVVLDDYKLVLGNTNKRRGLADSKYNERFNECAQAVKCLKNSLDINFLGEVSIEQFLDNKHLIEDPIVLKRAEHIVYEDERVLQAIEKLRQEDLMGFGKLLNQSHESLKELFEVTGIELDTMVSEAQNAKGCIGSRMTGAGFGGCTVSLVHKDYTESFIATVGERYNSKIGLTADFYVAEIGDGTKII